MEPPTRATGLDYGMSLLATAWIAGRVHEAVGLGQIEAGLVACLPYLLPVGLVWWHRR